VLADLGVVERRLERLEKDLKKNPTAELKSEQTLLVRCRAALENGSALRTLGLTGDDLKRLRGFQLLSAKPLLVVLNIDESDLPTLDHAASDAGLAPWIQRASAGVVAICAKIELEISQLDAADAQSFMADLGIHESGLDRVIRAAYDLLGYISFFTVGEDECRAWSIPVDTPAQEAAGAIHSDIQRGFIRAEVVGWDRLVERGSLAACRDHGELRLEGKEYLVADGDVITFRHAT
jgi:ribosome-binding ATPase YchF (GTP1/OBG family)